MVQTGGNSDGSNRRIPASAETSNSSQRVRAFITVVNDATNKDWYTRAFRE